MNQLKRVILMISLFFVILLFQTTTANARTVGVCIGENKEEIVYYKYINPQGDFVIDDKSVVSVESPEIARVVKKGTSAITWVGETKVYMNTLSITGLSEGTTKVYLDKPTIIGTFHNEVATVTVTQHQWGSEYRIDIEPTCILDGQKAIFCEKCSKKQDSSEIIIPAKGHTSVTDEAVVPTCTINGKTEGSHCSVCGEVIKKQEEIPATGHKAVVDKAVASTCIKAGKTEGSHCSVCGQVIKQQTEIPVTEHSWDNGSITKKPTADSEGKKTYTCTVCRTTKTEEIAKLTVAEKKAQKIKVTTSKKISLKNARKKSQSFKLSAKSTSGNKVKYKLIKGNRNIKFTASSGKVTIKKRTKKGTYKIKVKMTVSGDDEYKKSSVTKTITIKVK